MYYSCSFTPGCGYGREKEQRMPLSMVNKIIM